MLVRSLHFTLVLVVASSVFAAPIHSDKKQIQLLSKTVGFKLVAKNVHYDGVETESGDVCRHYDPLPYGGRNYYWSDAMTDGLFVDGGEGDSRIYQPYELANKAGWHKKREDDGTWNNVWGLFEFGGKIFMGSDGLGILEFDPAQNFWSRYDWQYAAKPDSLTILSFVDEHYLFFVSHGAALVYSRKYDLSAQLSTPLDSRLDFSQNRNGVDYLQFTNPETRQSYFTALEKEFKRLAASR